MLTQQNYGKSAKKIFNNLINICVKMDEESKIVKNIKFFVLTAFLRNYVNL